MNIQNLTEQWARMGPIVWAEHRYGWIGEDGTPIKLARWQRGLLSGWWQRREQVETIFISVPKKAGKTTLNSLILAYRWLTLPGLHLALGNDRDQSAELQISMIAAMVRRHPVLSRFVKVNRGELIFQPTGSRILSIPMDAGSAAGGNFLTTSWTELWAFVYEASERLYEELTPLPLVDSLRVVDSYAGFEAESLLLRRIWDRGLGGEPISDEWPMYLTGRQLSFIHSGEEAQKACWRGTDAEQEAYYREQQATLRPLTFQRLHLNQWTGSESPYIPIEWWDQAVAFQPVAADPSLRVILGVDAGLKRDSAAIVACAYDRDTRKVQVVNHRIYYPKPGEVLDIEDTIESTVKDFSQRFNVKEVRFDPWQFQRSAQTLAKDGITMAEYPQSVPNLTAMSTNLFELLKGGNLVAYPAADIRLAFQRAVAVESSRGVKIAKEKARHKIDVVVALAMAAHGAIEVLAKSPSLPFSWLTLPGDEEGQARAEVITWPDGEQTTIRRA